MKEIKKDLLKANEFIKNNKKDILKYTLISFLIILIALIPLFRSNFNYIDDLGRVRYGYRDFGFSRHISNILSTFLGTSKHLSDISPFTQMLGGLILSFTAALLIKLFTKDKKFNPLYSLIILPVYLNPYFLENYSYKFDSPFMALSILVCVIPFIFYNKKSKNYLYMIISTLCIVIMTTSYQASSGIYPIITLLYAFVMYNEKEDNKKITNFIIKSVISYILGLLIFKLFLEAKTYNYLNTDTFTIKELIPGIINNYSKYFNYFITDFKKIHYLLITIILVFFIINTLKQTKQDKLKSLISILLVLITTILLLFGVYPALKNVQFYPRVMYPVGILLGLISLLSIKDNKHIIPKLAGLYLSYSFVVIALTYGNCLSLQRKYTDTRINLLLNDLNKINTESSYNYKLDIVGDIKSPEPVERIRLDYKIIDRLIPPTLGDNNWVWAGYRLCYFYNLKGIEYNFGKKNNIEKYQMNKVVETKYHNIYILDDKMLIELK